MGEEKKVPLRICEGADIGGDLRNAVINTGKPEPMPPNYV